MPVRLCQLVEPIDWERMIDAMEGVMHDENGTARGAGQGLNYRIAGKTGTVQIFSIGQERVEASEIDDIAVIMPYSLDLRQQMPQASL